MKYKKELSKRILALLLAVVMVINFFPAIQRSVLAETAEHKGVFTFTVKDGVNVVAGATVHLYDASDNETQTVITDESGVAAVSSITSSYIPAQTKIVRYSVSMYGFEDTGIQEITISDTIVGAITPGGNLDVSLTAWPKVTVSGTVKCYSTNIGGATVKLSGYGEVLTTTTSADGSYSFNNVYDNGTTYKIEVTKSKYITEEVVANLAGVNNISIYKKTQVWGLSFGSSNYSIDHDDLSLERYTKAVYDDTDISGSMTYKISDADLAVAEIYTEAGAKPGELLIHKAGTVTVTAIEETDYEYATASYILHINKLSNSNFKFEVLDTPSSIYKNDTTFHNKAIDGLGTGAVTYSVDPNDNGIVSVNEDGSFVFGAGTGDVTISATIAADGFYESETISYDIEVKKALATVSLTYTIPQPANIVYSKDATFENAIVGEDPSITYAVYPEGIASIDAQTGKLTIIKAGKVTVTASKQGDDTYADATASYDLTIEKAEQTGFSLGADVELSYGTDTFELQATGGESTGEITYTITKGSDIAEIGGTYNSTLLFNDNETGTVEVTAYKAVDECYTVIKDVQTITVTEKAPPTDPFVYSGTTANTSGWYTGAVTVELKTEYVGKYKLSLSNSIRNTNIWSDKITISAEDVATYTIYLTDGYSITKGCITKQIKIDNIKPNNLSVTYSQPLKNIILQTLSFGFYNDTVTVTLEADDPGEARSQVASFAYSYEVNAGASSINVGGADTKIVKETDYSNEGKTATATFQIPAQFLGKVSFTATDDAGNTSDVYTDSKNIVVDTITPNASISYTTPSQIVDKTTNESLSSVTDNAKLMYNGNVTATLEIKEANFFEGMALGNNEYVNDVKIVVTRVDEEGIHQTSYVPYPTSDAAKRQITWASSGDKHTADIELSSDGDYSITIGYMDKSEHQMTITSPIENNKISTYQYTSNELSIDTTKPTIKVVYDNNTASNTDIFKADRTATISINEYDFWANRVDVSLKALDIQGNAVSAFNEEEVIAKLKKAESWTESSPNVWTAEITYAVDANYSFDIAYTDTAGNQNEAVNYGNEASLGKIFKIDKTAPDNHKFTIKYSQSLTDSIVSAITFGYYKAPVTATIMAEDLTSGIDYFTYSYIVKSGQSSVNTGKSDISITSQSITYSDKGKTATASFQIPAQFYGSVNFSATDKAGNKSNELRDSKVLVVDDISPTRNVTYSKPSQIVNKDTLLTQETESANSILYYNGEAKVTFKVNEANFDAADVDIRVAKNEENAYVTAPTDWKKDGDNWTGTLTLSGDGDYIITMKYVDKSRNEMTSFSSRQIVIDTITPTIQVSYSEGNVITKEENRKYYDAVQTATITMKEHNFRADDVAAVVTAKNVEGTKVLVDDYTAYLRNRNNWTKIGDVYTAKITYSVDANYTFDISYMDLSKNKTSDYSEEAFTVDKTAPKNLSVSYSNSVYKEILQSITFGYYNAPMTVTITAEDSTSGIDSFKYSYVNSEDVSSQNAQVSNASIQAKDIVYSDNGKKASATFSIPKSALTGSNQFKGKVEFTAVDKANRETEHKEAKNEIIVDSIAPNAEISYNEPFKNEKDVSYYAGEVEATIKVTEANFDAKNVEVMVSKNAGTAYEKAPTEWTQNGDLWTGSITLAAPADHSGDGDYFIAVNYTDKSTNKMTAYTSKQVTIDTILPTIEVTGLKNKSANNGTTVGFTITSSDVNFGSFTPKLSAVIMDSEGRFTNKVMNLGDRKTITNGNTYSYTVDNLDADGVYTLDCTTIDLAGNKNDTINGYGENKEYEQVTFSVNREGSTFALDASTKALVGAYFVKNVKADITISEVNVDPLAESTVELNQKVLTKDEDYTVAVQSGNNNWNEYQYQVNSELFQEEGEYKLVVNSKDKTGTSAYSDIKGAELAFVVDNTIPEAAISGIKEGGRYQTDAQTVTIVPKDPGGKLNSVQVILNGTETVVDVSGDKLVEELNKNKDKITFAIPSGMAQTVKINCIDVAGNISEHSIGKITVSTEWYILYYANKPFFYGSIIGGTTLLVALAAWLAFRKKKMK